MFVGTVIEANEDWARLDVAEVWRGDELAPQVRVITGTLDPNAGSSSDIQLEVGATYLIGAANFVASSCSVAVLDGPAAAAGLPSRPELVRAPVTGGSGGAVLPVDYRLRSHLPAVLVVALIAIVAVVSWQGVRRRRRRITPATG